MKMSAIAIALFFWVGGMPQAGSFEKQALSLVQRMNASSLDSELPNSPFSTWFKQLIGPKAGVIWQLTECGDRSDAASGAEKDIPACAEANAGLPDGRKVIVVITVGTFKKGLIGEPTFFRAFVERHDQLFQIRRLRDLPGMLSAPEMLPSSMSAIPVDLTTIKLPSQADYFLSQSTTLDTLQVSDKTVTARSNPQRISEGVLFGSAITKVKPLYPTSARKIQASGPVEVLITISENGRVIEARVISGNMALHNAALEAARKWVFKPTLLNGVPVKIQGALTFVFTLGVQ